MTHCATHTKRQTEPEGGYVMNPKMKQPNNEATAFPISGLSAFRGMSLRDYFAGQAISGLLASAVSDGDMLREVSAGHMAATAYLYADAMIEHRKTSTPDATENTNG